MNPIEPLLTLLAQTERERDAVQAEVQRAAVAQRQAEQQLEQLLGYRRDYETRWGEQFRQQGTMDVVHCYQGFTVRLGQAVEQQQRTARLATQRTERERVRLTEHELRVASVRKLIERRRADAQRSQDRRDQKQSDEFASRVAWARLQAQGGAGSLSTASGF